MPNFPYEAIIFDMDGLLVDSETVWHAAEVDLVAVRGHVYSDAFRAGVVGLRLDAFLTKLIDYHKLNDTPEQLKDELNALMLARIPTAVKPQPGAPELVAYVADQAIPIAIASSSPMVIIDAIIESQGWGEVFAQRFSADDDAHGKPAPDVYLRAAHTLGAEPSACLAFEDSPNGSRAAVAAGMTCFAVPDRSHTDPAALKAITPHVFDDLHAALALLQAEG